MRIAFEFMAIELAASRAYEEEAQRIRTAYIEARAPARAGDIFRLAEIDQLVHDFGCNSGGNHRLQQVLGVHLDVIQWTQNTIIQELPKSYEFALPEHVAVMDAVCARDAAGAARAVRAHLENAYRQMVSQLEAAHETGPDEGASR